MTAVRHRTVDDVMTHQVVTALRDTPYKTVVHLLARNDVAAVPVVDDQQRPIGIVSEADLLHKESAQPDPQGHGPGLWLRRKDRSRAGAETAGALMNAPVVTARPEWSLVEAARVMDRHHLKRLAVVDEAGRLVGIVSRSDLLGVFLRHDRAILDEIRHDVLEHTLYLAPDAVSVQVLDGVVTLRGKLERRSLVPITVRLCRAVDGVVTVHDHLRFDVDDRRVDLHSPGIGGVRPYQARF
jgi:CBS-domain-containing membrane protein